MLSQLGEGGEEGEEGEEGLVKMMEGMMSTLLSRDVLYPSLSDICKQVYMCKLIQSITDYIITNYVTHNVV